MVDAQTSAPPPQESRGTAMGWWLLAGVGLALVLTFTVLAAVHGTQLHHNSGAWATLAADLRQGLLYRPLEQDGVYGGTRFMPLFPILHAFVMRFVSDPLDSGILAGLLGLAVFVWGFTASLRRARLAAGPGAACLALVLLLVPVAEAGPTARGDLLSVAFGLLGLAAALGEPPTRRALVLAATCFALAWYARFLTVSACAAVCLHWWWTGRRRPAAVLASGTVGIAALLTVATQVASDGRFLGILRTCMTGESTWLHYLRGAAGVRRMVFDDPALVAFVVVAVPVLLLGWRRLRSDPLLLAALLAWGLVTLIGDTPGVARNHLIEALALSGLALARALTMPDRDRSLVAGVVVASAVAASMMLGWIGNARNPKESYRLEFARALALMPREGGPVLSDQPYLPLAARERPQILDAYMVLVLSLEQPAFREPLLRDLRARRFRAVALIYDPDTERGDRYYRESHFGGEFLPALRSGYTRHPDSGRYTVFVRRE